MYTTPPVRLHEQSSPLPVQPTYTARRITYASVPHVERVPPSLVNKYTTRGRRPCGTIRTTFLQTVHIFRSETGANLCRAKRQRTEENYTHNAINRVLGFRILFLIYGMKLNM